MRLPPSLPRKISNFHERWVVGYGHASVAEHAILHVALEGISRLSCEAIESCRLASYTEKSSRYQVFNSNHYYTPEKLLKSSTFAVYKNAIEGLFDLYQRSLVPIKVIIEKQYPRREDEEQRPYEGRIRSKYIDNSRYLIPSASLTNVGVTINARSLEYTTSKLLSSSLDEVNQIGYEIKEAGPSRNSNINKIFEIKYIFTTGEQVVLSGHSI